VSQRSRTRDGRGARVYLTPEEILLLRIDLNQQMAKYGRDGERPHLTAKLRRAYDRARRSR
jgi:hypothetical protein